MIWPEVVVINPDPEILAERARLGLDVFDEVWNGEYHMVPPPKWSHQGMASELYLVLGVQAKRLGLGSAYETGLFPEGRDDYHDYRVPDLMIFDLDRPTELGIGGAPLLAVEVRSPRDESFKKIPFYEAVGTAELLIIERERRWIRRWRLVAGKLVETTEPEGQDPVQLDAVPVELAVADGRLRCTVEGEPPTWI